ncbi:MAG: 50S ribosomal protein L13 [Candidatus Micrarchaeia archaeon]
MKINPNEYEVYDAKDEVLGRLSTKIAKALLNNKKVAVVNAKYAVISGDISYFIKKYQTRLDLQEKENPEHSPYWSRRPDLLVKRVIRGMLPYRYPRGKAAFRNLKVFINVPEEFKDSQIIKVSAKNPHLLYTKFIYIKDLSERLGYKTKV